MRNSVGFFTMNNSVELFLQQGSFRSNLSRARYIWSDVLHVTILVNYRCEKLEHIFHMWCFRSNVSQLCGELNLFFHSFTAVKYWIEFLTSDIYGRISYMWHILVKYRWEKFGRIFHMWCILLNMWWLWRIWSNCSHLWSIRSYSSCLTYSVGTLQLIFSANVGVRNSVGFFTYDVFCRIYHDCDEFGGMFSQLWKIRRNYSRVLYLVRCQTGDTLSVNKGVRNSVAFFTCDVFCPISHNLYKLGRFFLSRVVYHWISHVWHNRSNILHETLSSNIGVRNSVGFFTCDVFCRIWDNFVEFGQTVHICEVFDRIPHVWPIKSDILHLIFSANIGVRNSVGFFTCDVFCPICHILYDFDRFLPHMCSISLNF